MEIVFGSGQDATTRTVNFPLFHDQDAVLARQSQLGILNMVRAYL